MQKPEKKFNCGPISVSIWAKTMTVEGDMRKCYSVTIDKTYKEDEDWKHTNSFNIEDLPKVALVTNEAYRYIRLKSTNSDE